MKGAQSQTLTLTTKDTSEWRQYSERVSLRDVYFDPDYLRVFEETYGYEARLFVLRKGDSFVAYPFYLRSLSTLPFWRAHENTCTGQFDIISTWYFGGPFMYFSEGVNESEMMKMFLEEFHSYCLSNGVVSEFARLHPILRNQEIIAKVAAGTERNRAIVYVDLSQDEQSIWANFKKSNRNAIAKAKRVGVYIERLDSGRGVETFRELYDEAMDRKQARAEYRFSPEFYVKLTQHLPNAVTVFLARYQGQVAASSLFIHKNDFVHYYLSASDPRFLGASPNNLLLYEAILWAKDSGYKHFVLGGGYEPDDDLLKFKLGFSKTTADFHVFRKVHDAQAYAKLCKLRDHYDNSIGISSPKTGYFPEYRRPSAK